jgi:phage gp45-like
MSLFVEVTSVEKGCPVIVNLDHIVEIAPLVEGGCALFTADGAGMNSKSAMRVKENYDQFKQFAMQTVTAEDIERRFPKTKKTSVTDNIQIPTLK